MLLSLQLCSKKRSSLGVFHVFLIAQMVLNRAERLTHATGKLVLNG